MAQPAIRVEGLREVLRDLERFGASTDDLRAAFGAIAATVAAEAGGIVRRDTGRLAGTIRPGRAKNKAIVRAGSAAVPYAGVVNYHRPGDVFLTGPANRDPDEKARMIEAELSALIVKHGLR